MLVPIDKFLSWLRSKNLKDDTVRNYLDQFNRFHYDKFTQQNVNRFFSNTKNINPNARSFINNMKRYLIVNARELCITGDYLQEILNIEAPKVSGRNKMMVVKPIPQDKIKLIEENLTEEKDKLRLLLTFYCGLRVGELFKISPSSFNWEKWKQDTTKQGELLVYGKGNREGIAIVPASLMVRIARYIRNKGFPSINTKIFGSEEDNPGIIRNITKTWRVNLRDAGLKVGINKVHPHRLRHSYATHLLLDKHMDIRIIQEALRHSSINSTMIYTAVDKEKLKEELERVKFASELDNPFILKEKDGNRESEEEHKQVT